MIKTEFYMERDDGVRLIRTYSDSGKMIRQVDTLEEYDAAIYPENIERVFVETDIPIDPGALPDDLEESAAYLLRGGMVEIPDRDEDPDYFNEHEPEPEYFG